MAISPRGSFLLLTKKPPTTERIQVRCVAYCPLSAHHCIPPTIQGGAEDTCQLFGHHFSSVAGAAPIVGPCAVAIIWGWVPALLWVVLGTIFMGAAHDLGALVLSMRHGGKSIGGLAEDVIGPRAKTLFLTSDPLSRVVSYRRLCPGHRQARLSATPRPSSRSTLNSSSPWPLVISSIKKAETSPVRRY